MKKMGLSLFALLGAAFAGFLLGFLLGRNPRQAPVTLSLPAPMTAPRETLPPATQPETEAVQFPIDLNTATQEQLTALPGIGAVLAGRIVAYREAHGPFTCAEELLNIEDIGEKRLETILDYITIGG